MSEKGDCRRLKRARYHEWLRRRWKMRAMAAAERRDTNSRKKGGVQK